MCMHVSLCIQEYRYPWRSEALNSPEVESSQTPALGIEPSSLGEQKAGLTTGPSLQLLNADYFFHLYFYFMCMTGLPVLFLHAVTLEAKRRHWNHDYHPPTPNPKLQMVVSCLPYTFLELNVGPLGDPVVLLTIEPCLWTLM